MKDVPVCHISTVHQPDDVRILEKECRTLAEHGFDVYYVVKNNVNKVVDGVKIVPLPYPRSRLERILKLPWIAATKALRTGAVVIHVHDPELLPASFVLKLFGKKVIYDVHEDLPKQIESKEWIRPLFRKTAAVSSVVVEWLAGYTLSAIVAVTPSIANRFPSQKTIIVRNYPDIKGHLVNMNMEYSKRPNVIIYTGGITRVRGAREMISAMERVNPKLNATLVLAGRYTPSKLEQELKRMPGWRMTKYLGWLSREEVNAELSNSKVGLLLFHPEPNHLNALPNKLFEYMAAGIPVIASDFPLWREIIEKSGSGLLVDPLKPEKIAKAIEWILKHPDEAEKMGRRGREAVVNEYNWGTEAEKLVHLYERLTR